MILCAAALQLARERKETTKYMYNKKIRRNVSEMKSLGHKFRNNFVPSTQKVSHNPHRNTNTSTQTHTHSHTKLLHSLIHMANFSKMPPRVTTHAMWQIRNATLCKQMQFGFSVSRAVISNVIIEMPAWNQRQRRKQIVKVLSTRPKMLDMGC